MIEIRSKKEGFNLPYLFNRFLEHLFEKKALKEFGYPDYYKKYENEEDSEDFEDKS